MRHDDLRCPQYGCQAKPNLDEIKLICTDEVFKKYKRFCDNTLVAKDKNLMFCVTPECETVIDTRDFKKEKMITCPTCQISICKKCRKHHDNSKCPEDDFSPVDNWIGTKSTALVGNCPKCQSVIEKDGGCSNMTCKICKHHYCWICHSSLDSWVHNRCFEDLCQFWNTGYTGYSAHPLYNCLNPCFKRCPGLMNFLTLLIAPPFVYIAFVVMGFFAIFV